LPELLPVPERQLLSLPLLPPKMIDGRSPLYACNDRKNIIEMYINGYKQSIRMGFV
jgi:hypothetical protein